MRITRKVYDEIVCFFSDYCDTEQGGMLGSSTGMKIDIFVPDINPFKRTGNIYKPNVEVLNLHLEKWDNTNILFCGMIHSHLTNTPKLSLADEHYIRKILGALQINRMLWFPIVLYMKEGIEIVPYKIEYNITKNSIQSYREYLFVE